MRALGPCGCVAGSCELRHEPGVAIGAAWWGAGVAADGSRPAPDGFIRSGTGYGPVPNRRWALGARRSALGARRSALGVTRSALGARRWASGTRLRRRARAPAHGAFTSDKLQELGCTACFRMRAVKPRRRFVQPTGDRDRPPRAAAGGCLAGPDAVPVPSRSPRRPPKRPRVSPRWVSHLLSRRQLVRGRS